MDGSATAPAWTAPTVAPAEAREHARARALEALRQPPARARAWALPAIAWLEAKRLLRSWKWRALPALFVVAAYALGHVGTFGEAAPARFPGGQLGLLAILALVAGAGVFLAVETAGVDDRRAARPFTDCRPVHPVIIALARWLAVFATLLLPPAIPAAWPFITAALAGAELPLAGPSLLAGGLVAAPLAAAAVGSGLLGRCLAGRDGPGFALGGLLALPPLAFVALVGEPASIFTSASRLLGVLVPLEVLAWDAALLAAYGVAVAGLAGLFSRRRRARTALRSVVPPRRAPSPFLAALARSPLEALRGLTLGGAAGLLLAGACAPLAAMLVRDAWLGWENRPAERRAVDWGSLREPTGTLDGIVPPAPIVERDITLGEPGEPPRVTLALQPREPMAVAAVTFGDFLRPQLLDEGRARLSPTAEPALWFLQFDPPLQPGERLDATFRLAAQPWGWRHVAQTTHPVFASWAGLGPWHGDGLEVNFRRRTLRPEARPSPYQIDAPAAPGRTWAVETAEASDLPGDRVLLADARPGLPTALTLSRLLEVRDDSSGLDVRFLVFPEREELARALHVAWRSRFNRLARLFGEDLPPLAYQETPIPGAAASGLRIPSPLLDTLQDNLALYDDWRRPTAGIFDAAFGPIHRAAVDRVVQASFPNPEDEALLVTALADYVDRRALLRGATRSFIQARTEWTIVPWDWANARRDVPYGVREASEAGWRGPALASLRTTEDAPLAPSRLESFHHLVRYLLGDDAWCATWRELVARGPGAPLHVDDLRQVAQQHTDVDLQVVFDEWLVQGVLPEYRIEELLVSQRVNPETSAVEYTTSAVVVNAGDGSIPVECVLVLDGDTVRRREALGPGERRELVFETRFRPLSFEIDPLGWIPQRLRFDTVRGQPIRNQVFVKAVRQE